MTPVRIDHRQEGYDRLLDIFKDKPNIIAMLRIYLKQHDDLESVIYQLLDSRHLSDLDTVIGDQLDVIGEIIGEDRGSKTDEAYRKAIMFRIGIINSQATPNYIANLLKDTTESTEVKYYNHFPASYIIEFNGDEIPDDFLIKMQDTTAAGVNAGFIHNKNDLGWICCEVGSTATIADKSILPEYTALTGISASEIYMENVNPTTTPVVIKGEKLRQAFAITEHVGNAATTLDVDVGLDLSASGSMLIWWNSQAYYVYNFSEYFAPIGGATGGFRQWYENTVGSSINQYCDLSFTTTGFTEPPSVPLTRINGTGQNNKVHSLKSTPEVLEVFEYIGDGTLSQTINHTLGKTPLYMSIQTKDGGRGVTQWFKDMDSNEFYNNFFKFNIGAILGGSTPTSTHITVGDIGGTYSPNVSGVEYVVLLLADNPDEGITGGSYISTGVAGQEVIIGNEVGLLNIQKNIPVMYSKLTGVEGKAVGQFLTSPVGALQQINVDSNKIVLGAQNDYTNAVAGSTHYWFNIADPDSIIN